MPKAQYTLPGRYFTSAAIFHEERERIFYDRWICVGREEQLAEGGAYFLAAVGEESLIVVRDHAGQCRAFYNVCRHRGTRLCQTAHGQLAHSIQCPYHAWTYTLDGQLVGVPDMHEMEGFDKADYPLNAVALTVWEGFIFINLSPDPRPWAETFAPLVNRYNAWHIADLRRAHQIEYTVQANWKLIVENYNECYHCPLIHPAFNKISHYRAGNYEFSEGAVLGGYMNITHGGDGSMTLSGHKVATPIGTVAGEDANRVYYLALFPNLLLSLHPDYVMFHTLWPTSPSETRVVCEWLFDPTTMAQPDFTPADAVEFWDMTNRQDWHACEIAQLGVRSRGYIPGPFYNWQEQLLAEFDRQVLKALGHPLPN